MKMRKWEYWLAVVALVLAILSHAAIPRYELLAVPTVQSGPADVPYGDYYGGARFPTVVRLDRWTGTIEAGSLVQQIGTAPKWYWVRLDQ